MKALALATLAAATLAASTASASVVFSSTFESAGIGNGSWTTLGSIEGWTSSTHGIEVQNHAAGNPAATGGDVFVELDTNQNSSMERAIGAGTYDLSFLYSPRPGIAAGSNGIDVFMGATLLGSFTGAGAGDTIWSMQNLHFTTAGGLLRFAATGTSDSLGGYVDNITLSTAGVPEPATWALMIGGFGLAGSALRRRKTAAHAA